MAFPRPLGALLTILLLAACSGPEEAPPAQSPEETPVSQEAGPAPTLDYARSLGVMNAAEPLPGVLTAGQPTEEQIEALAGAGFGTFVSLRPVSEEGAGWEEAWAAERGLAFHRIPVAGADDLSPEAAAELDRILAEAGPAVVYCASSNRVGALLALRAHQLGEASPEEALELGRRAGLTRLEPAVARILGVEGR